MDEKNFELILKNSARKSSALYAAVSSNPTDLKPQDVLDSVNSEIKKMQLADSRSSNINKDLSGVKKPYFLTVNKLPNYIGTPKQTNTFETQCISNTQLINMIDDAEALIDHHKGMTQEFETTFIHNVDINSDTHCETDVTKNSGTHDRDIKCAAMPTQSNTSKGKKDLNAITNIIGKTTAILSQSKSKKEDVMETDEFETTFTQTNVDKTVSLLLNKMERNHSSDSAREVHDVMENVSQAGDTVASYVLEKDITDISIDYVSHYETAKTTETLKMCKHTKDNVNYKDRRMTTDVNDIIMQNVAIELQKIKERSPSPVFNIKAKPRNKTNQPLVVSLETFEKFARLAIPLIESNDDFDYCKHLINSQLLGGELCLNTGNLLFNDYGTLSPILEKSCEIFKGIENKPAKTPKYCIINKDATRDKKSDSLEDEILFSSDEETDYTHREFQNLSLTAVLETSFYNNSNVLEETMYVGFQTASNKSIQICTNSFQKAQSLLDEGEKNSKDIRVTELVEYHSAKNTKNNFSDFQEQINPIETKLANIHIPDKVTGDQPTDDKELIKKNNEDTEIKPPENKLAIMKTDNKNIVLSDKSLKLGSNVFIHINLDEKIDVMNDWYSSSKVVIDDKKSNANENSENVHDKIEDDLILQEFENIEMSLEKIEPTKKIHKFLGFKTANNISIDISDASKTTIKNIFQGIDLGEINEKTDNINDADKMQPAIAETETQFSCKTSAFTGFKTANNKNIKVSSQALAKTNKIFQDIDEETDKKYDSNHASSNKLALAGFQTANNKEIKISKAAITKSTQLFKDIDTKKPYFEKEKYINQKSCQAFKTANNKNINISIEALQKSKKILQDLDKNDQLINPGNLSNKNSCFGTQTANNKSITVSVQSLTNSKYMLEDLDTRNMQVKDLCGDHKTTEDKNIAFKGFQTASNKAVVVSKEALVKSINIFQDINDDGHCEINSLKKVNLKGQTVQLNDQHLKETVKKIDFENDKLEKFVGFKTASNKNVNISKEALAKSKKMYEEAKLDKYDTINETTKITSEFHTASNKNIEVKKKAIEKLESIDDIEADQKESTFLGFQTASKKKVGVSKEAIEKSKALFKDIEIPEQENTTFVGFQTANKKKVKDSLPITKGYFDISKDTPKKIQTDFSNKIKRIRNSKALTDVDIENIINTQVLNDFEETLCTEDFNETPRNKRSGSPILSCPRAKKKKRFETPYKNFKTNICDKPVEIQSSKITLETITDNKKCKLFTDNYKKNKIYTLKDLPKFDNHKSNIDPYIPNFNLDNILNFEFVGKRNELTGTKIKMEELKNIFLSGINKNLVPEGWLDNHLKLILWKLLSYEVKLSCCLCTVQNVIDQVKYRYDKELYNAERPVLRKIFEKDDVSTRTMVLCVAGIYVDGVSVSSTTNSENIELLLTDGWYFIKATIDKMLSTLVHRGRIVVGSKLVTTGAELVNCEQGIAPWEDTSATRLKLSGNSTRPASWHATLGYSTAAILSRLSTVKLDGGKVARLKVYVARVYPLLYVEKFADGSTLTRSERLEHLHQMKYDTERELMMEKIYEEVQKEFSDQESQDSEGTPSKRRCLETGSQIAKMMKHSKDPTEFRAQLTSSQVRQLQEHTSRYRDRMLEAIQNKIQERHIGRNVVTLVRCRIVDVKHGGVDKGMLSIWKPNDAILELVKEGSWIEVMNVVPTAIRYSEIQITAGRQSVFRPVKTKMEHPSLLALKRTYYKISDVADNPTMTTDYNEIDTVGIVFLIEPNNQEFESSRNFQNVYLADADKNIISVNLWGGVKKFGFLNILDTGQIVACANLQKRAGNTTKNIPQFRATELSYFTKTPKNIQAKEMVDDLNKKLFGLDRRKFCDDCVAIRNNYTAIRCLGNTESRTPYRYNQNDYSLTRNKMFIDTPVSIKATEGKTTSELNLTGLDFESSFKQPQELSPKTSQRKRKVNERIAKLKMYGEPPPLSPINIINKSLNAKNSYRSPLTNTHIHNSVAISKLPEESPKTVSNCEKSPIISLKRSYVRSIPVKLNFENDNNSVDHFAEEFDASPPLSLE